MAPLTTQTEKKPVCTLKYHAIIQMNELETDQGIQMHPDFRTRDGGFSHNILSSPVIQRAKLFMGS